MTIETADTPDVPGAGVRGDTDTDPGTDAGTHAGTDTGAEAAGPGRGAAGRGSLAEVFTVALRLGLTSFGGPIAHLGYFRSEYVERRKWLDEATYADLVAVSQSLPGPSSSMLGMSIGTLRAGLAGGVAAWLGFTLPSAVMLVLFGYGADAVGSDADGWLHGLKVVAVAVVALAVWSMAKSLAFDRVRGSVAILAAILMLSWQETAAQFMVIAAGAGVGWLLLGRHRGAASESSESSGSSAPPVRVPLGRRTVVVCASLFVGLLVALPVARHNLDNQAVNVADGFYRSGALVFGGGHVVLPLLEAEVVDHGWLSEERFLAGYGAAQAVPGPLFTFGGYLGTVMEPEPNGVPGAVLGLVAIFLPGYLLMMGALPLWGALRTRPQVQASLAGVNAAVVGILLAALYDPVATSAIRAPTDFALALAAFGALALWKVPPWVVVILAAATGAVMGAV